MLSTFIFYFQFCSIYRWMKTKRFKSLTVSMIRPSYFFMWSWKKTRLFQFITEDNGKLICFVWKKLLTTLRRRWVQLFPTFKYKNLHTILVLCKYYDKNVIFSPVSIFRIQWFIFLSYMTPLGSCVTVHRVTHEQQYIRNTVCGKQHQVTQQ